MSDKKTPKHVTFADDVAKRLIEMLEQGTAPWQRPWETTPALAPYNPTTGNAYSNTNYLWLSMQAEADPRWMTYKQAQAAGWQVKKGSKSVKIIGGSNFYERDKKDEQGNVIRNQHGEKEKEMVFKSGFKTFNVFNAKDVEGIPPLERIDIPKHEWEPNQRAEHILKESGADITHVVGNRAFYRPATDTITLPEKSQFKSDAHYYGTALHELGHWTGHSSRLDRDLKHPFGSIGYAKEELRAEIGSFMLSQALGVAHDPSQHASYVASWIKVLKEDPQEIIKASRDAGQIKDFVMGFDKQREAERKPVEQEHTVSKVEQDIEL